MRRAPGITKMIGRLRANRLFVPGGRGIGAALLVTGRPGSPPRPGLARYGFRRELATNSRRDRGLSDAADWQPQGPNTAAEGEPR
jgi:hypothetical protein